MGWLSGWAKRIKITIDHLDIDSALSNFPILVYLSTSSGRNNDDVTCVFDEVGSNSKKIAVTKADGTTECYVEVEKWDSTNEKAWLWVKVPDISSTVDTDLYLYYDNNHADNTTYVGDPNSTPAENVWDSNFKFVSHMKDDPDTSHIRDSTSNNNDGTKTATNEPIQVTGKIDKGQDFDGTNDEVSIADHVSLRPNYITVEAWVNIASGWSGNPRPIGKYNPDWANKDYQIRANGTSWQFGVGNGTAAAWATKSSSIVAGSFSYVVGVYDGSEVKVYVDGVVGTDSDLTGAIQYTANKPLKLGQGGTGGDWFEGIVDEVRVSSGARTAAWIKATYESGRDHLLDFGSEETSGQIYEINVDAVVKASAEKSLQTTFNIQKDAAVTSQAVEASQSTFNISKDAIIKALATSNLEATFNLFKDAITKIDAAVTIEQLKEIFKDAVVNVSASPQIESVFNIRKDAAVLVDVTREVQSIFNISKDVVVQALAEVSVVTGEVKVTKLFLMIGNIALQLQGD